MVGEGGCLEDLVVASIQSGRHTCIAYGMAQQEYSSHTSQADQRFENSSALTVRSTACTLPTLRGNETHAISAVFSNSRSVPWPPRSRSRRLPWLRLWPSLPSSRPAMPAAGRPGVATRPT